MAAHYRKTRSAALANRKQYRESNREKIAAARKVYDAKNSAVKSATARKNKLKRNFGITLAEYDALLLRQGGVCALCDGPCITGVRLAVDHDHKTGRVRGLLCLICNVGIGAYEKFNTPRVWEYLK